MSTSVRAAPGRGMVATSQVHASRAGVAMLRAGGNAADAAIATAAAMAVTEPTSGGLGGDCFALHYQAQTGQVTALNGSGRCPAALSLERLDREGLRELPPFHPYTITVPGACAGWFDLHQRFGSLPMTSLLQPAIELAESGFAVGPITAHEWSLGASAQLGAAVHGKALLPGGRAPIAGQVMRNPELARVLRDIAADGSDLFYRGWIAENMVDTVRAAGGALAMADLAGHTSSWEQPIAIDVAGVRLFECGPSGQGIIALMALGMLERLELADIGAPLSAERLHLVIEALRLAFADASEFVADPDFAQVPSAGLLARDYLAERAALIDRHRAAPAVGPGRPQSGGTYYLTVVDGFGNACSFIQSCYMGFGTGIVPRGTGFTLHNRGHNFSLEPGHRNCLAPGKRPYHTIIPALATSPSGELVASFGVMGGFMQPQGQVQVALGLFCDGDEPQAVLDRPRVRVDPHRQQSQVEVEDGLDPATVAELSRRGHATRIARGMLERAAFGRGQIIMRSTDGSLQGGSDRRGDGTVEVQ